MHLMRRFFFSFSEGPMQKCEENDMKNIDGIKNELRQAIIESAEYQEYKELQERLDKNPDLKRAVDDYRRRNFELQYNESVDDLFTATQNLSREYEDIKNQILVRKYLDAEICLCREIQDICMSVVEVVDFDMDFLT